MIAIAWVILARGWRHIPAFPYCAGEELFPCECFVAKRHPTRSDPHRIYAGKSRESRCLEYSGFDFHQWNNRLRRIGAFQFCNDSGAFFHWYAVLGQSGPQCQNGVRFVA